MSTADARARLDKIDERITNIEGLLNETVVQLDEVARRLSILERLDPMGRIYNVEDRLTELAARVTQEPHDPSAALAQLEQRLQDPTASPPSADGSATSCSRDRRGVVDTAPTPSLSDAGPERAQAGPARDLQPGQRVVVDLAMGGLTLGTVMAVEGARVTVDCGPRGGGVVTVSVDRVAPAPRSCE